MQGIDYNLGVPLRLLAAVLGCVTAVAVGSCGDEPITELTEPATIVVTPTEITLEVPGGTVQLPAEVQDRDGAAIPDAAVAWTTGDSTVVTVSDSGLVAAVRTGNTDVTARHGTLEASASIAVVGPTVIVVTPTEATLEVPDGTVQLSAEVRDQDGAAIPDAAVAWTTGDSAVATVSDSGLVAAVRTGNTDVTARHGTLEASASIAVVGPTVIVVTPTEATLEVPDGTVQLSAEVRDRDGAAIPDAAVAWTTGDSAVATVSDSGLVAAVRTGNTDVTARHGTFEASASIAVVGPTVIVVTPAEATLEVPDGTVQLSAEVRDQDGAAIPDAAVAWTTGDSAVATVSDSGLVAAVRTGNTNVTARHGALEASASIAVVVGSNTQRYALKAFYEAAGGDRWHRNDNWLSQEPLSEWYGLGVEDAGPKGEGGRLTKIGLAKNGLSGMIAPEIGHLRDLELLYLQGNDLSGPIPPEIADAAGLNALILQGNRLLEGLLPPTITRLRPTYFSYEDTGLCLPRSDSFAQWMDGIPQFGPQPCSAPRHDRLVLTEVYHALGGPGWARRDGWLSQLPLDAWDGVSVDSAGRVAGLNLAENGVEGELPPSLGYLDALKRLDLSENTGLAGTLGDWTRDLSLDSLHLAGATLCVPPGPGFDEWLTSLRHWSGSRCGEPASIRTAVPVVYLVQTTQNRRGDVPLIAGRDALLRVFAVADEPNYFDSDARAEFYLDEQMVHAATMTLEGRSGIPLQVDESLMRNSYTSLIPGDVLVPGVQLVVILDPERRLPLKAGSQLRVPEVGKLALDVTEMPVMELTVVPVQFTDQGDAVSARVSELELGSPELHGVRTMLPIKEVDFAVREPITVARSDWTANSLGILAMLRRTDGANGHYIGISSGRRGGVAALGGRVSSSSLHSEIIAHEIGHNLSLQHARCGQGLWFVDPDYPYGGGRTGVWGFDSELGELREPTLPDVMSYCDPVWISDYQFVKALNFRKAKAAPGRPDPAAREKNSKTTTLLLWGRITASAVILEPAVILDAIPSLPDTSGPYRVVGTGDGDDVLFSLEFAPMIEAEGGEGYFVFTLPFEAGWESLARITLSGPAGSDSMTRETHRPLTIMVDSASGRVRSVLSDLETVPLASEGLSVKQSHGLPITRRR